MEGGAREQDLNEHGNDLFFTKGLTRRVNPGNSDQGIFFNSSVNKRIVAVLIEKGARLR